MGCFPESVIGIYSPTIGTGNNYKHQPGPGCKQGSLHCEIEIPWPDWQRQPPAKWRRVSQIQTSFQENHCGTKAYKMQHHWNDGNVTELCVFYQDSRMISCIIPYQLWCQYDDCFILPAGVSRSWDKWTAVHARVSQDENTETAEKLCSQYPVCGMVWQLLMTIRGMSDLKMLNLVWCEW